ncbi:hypothetical protein ACFQ6V_13835 [Streptomyces roseifaciens]
MSASEQSAGETMPRPERTPDALRLALVRPAPHRCTEAREAAGRPGGGARLPDGATS